MNAIFITGCFFALASFAFGYIYGKEVGRVEGNVQGRKAIRKQYEQVGR